MVVLQNCSEDDGWIFGVPRGFRMGRTNDTIDLLQPDCIQARRQFAAELIDRKLPLVGCALGCQFLLLPHQLRAESDQDSGRHQDGGDEQNDLPFVARDPHTRTLGYF